MLALATGCLVFAWIGYLPALDPRSVAWVFHEDPFTHAMGWEHFRNTPLFEYPIGRNEAYGIEWSSSVVFSDSIPLVAVLLKPLSAWLPTPFQYLGWWVLLCLVLQAYWGARLVMLRSDRLRDGAVGALLFATAPVLLERAGVQTALGSHWLLLWALWLYLSCRRPCSKAWAILLLVAAGVHAYLLVIGGAIWIAHLVACRQRGALDRRDLMVSAATLCGVIVWMHALGYFMAGAAEGIWRSHFDVGGFVAPSRGARLAVLPHVHHAAWDGSAYLGAGLVLVLGATLAIWLVRWARRVPRSPRGPAEVTWAPLLVCVVAFTAFALTNKITLFNHEVFTVPVPRFVDKIYAVFRGGNRMIWPAYYLSMLGIVWWVLRVWPDRLRSAVLVATCAVQLVDLEGMAAIKRTEARGITLARPLPHDVWSAVAEHYRQIVSVPSSVRQTDWPTIAWFAAQHGLATNLVYVSRYDWPKVAAATRERAIAWRTGRYRSDTAYVFPDEIVWALARQTLGPQDLAVVADGVRLILPNGRSWYRGDLGEVRPAEVPLPLGRWISLGDAGSMGLLLDGWSWSEWWGTWTDGERAWLVLPVPANERVRVTFRWKAILPRGTHQSVQLQMGAKTFAVDFHDPRDREDSFEITPTSGMLDVRLRVAHPVTKRQVRNHGVKELRSIGVAIKAVRIERLPDAGPR